MNNKITYDRKRLKPGDLVMVTYPLNEKSNNPAHKFEGETFVIKSRYQPKATVKPQFTLYKCTGALDMPYWFLEEELLKI